MQSLYLITRKQLIVLFLCGVYVCCSVGITYGATETFTVPAIVGSDSTPPSVPGNLVATAVATTQIDLTWDSATDNYILSGYHVWRDGVRIATTSLTTYSDTGLTESTLYTYYVTAYDSVFNESASSTIASTTTLTTPAPPSPTATSSTTYGSRAHPLHEEIESISVFPSQTGVLIRYTTSSHIRAVVRWGMSTSYEVGSLAEDKFTKTHEARIDGLEPGTTYHFILEGENSIHRYGTMYNGTFNTLPPDDVFPPENVARLTATIEGDDVLLTWENPHDIDFVKVRMVRSDLFYPSDTADGWVVYEGDGTSVRDVGVLKGGKRQYYTIFAYDALDNVSSGAVVSIVRKNVVGVPEEGSTTESVGGVPMDPAQNELALRWDDISFIQDGERIQAEEDGVVTIDGSKQLTVLLPYDRVPEHLKTILVSVTDGTESDFVFTFLLRINRDKTAYTSIIAPFGRSGDFPVQLSVFDYTTAQIGYVDGTLASRIKVPEVSGDVSFLMNITRSLLRGDVIYLMWFVIALILLAYLGRRVLYTL